MMREKRLYFTCAAVYTGITCLDQDPDTSLLQVHRGNIAFTMAIRMHLKYSFIWFLKSVPVLKGALSWSIAMCSWIMQSMHGSLQKGQGSFYLSMGYWGGGESVRTTI